MAAYLMTRGFPADRLLLKDKSRNTEENLLFSKAIMDELRPGARATVVTSDFHAFRAALLARRLGIRGQVTGARVAGYYRPSADAAEFAAVFLRYWVVNLGICALLVAAPLGAAALRYVARPSAGNGTGAANGGPTGRSRSPSSATPGPRQLGDGGRAASEREQDHAERAGHRAGFAAAQAGREPDLSSLRTM